MMGGDRRPGGQQPTAWGWMLFAVMMFTLPLSLVGLAVHDWHKSKCRP